MNQQEFDNTAFRKGDKIKYGGNIYDIISIDFEGREITNEIFGTFQCEEVQYIPLSATVSHPPHYGGKDAPFEAIKVIEAWNLDFCLGNTVKYIARAGKKDTRKLLEDLEKAKFYLDRKINQLK